MLYSAILEPAHGGFDMWDYSEYFVEEGFETLEDLIGFLRAEGLVVEHASDLNGSIYNQNCELGYGTPIKSYNPCSDYDPEEGQPYTYRLVWESET